MVDSMSQVTSELFADETGGQRATAGVPRRSPNPSLPRKMSLTLPPSYREPLAIAMLVALAVVTVLSWGGPEQLLAQGDQFPVALLNPEKRLPAAFTLWNSTWTGGGDLHYDAGLVLLSIVAWLPRTIGVSAAVLQRAEFALLLIGMLLSMYALPAKLGITSRKLPRALASVAYAYSLALTAQVADILMYLVFLLVVLLPVLYSHALFSSRHHFAARVAVFALASTLFAYVFANPPQVVVATVQIAVLCALITFQRGFRGVPASRIAVILAATVLINIWWIVPAVITTFDPTLQFVAPTSVLTWSWTQVESSFLHVWQATPLWGWPHPEYYPWATFYDSRAAQILLLWPLVVAAAAILLNGHRPRRLAASPRLWLVASLVTAFMVKGLHPPLTSANLWLYDHVPGFFLFREPETKFAEPLDFSTAMLLAIVLCRVWSVLAVRHAVWKAAPLAIAVLLGVLAVPSYTGLVTADASARIAPFRVTIPTYWWQAAAYVNGLPSGGLALLPNDDFYAMPYTWGMYAADLLPEELFNRPVYYLSDTPQGYLTASFRLQGIESQLIDALRAGRPDELPSTLGSQGVRYVLLRRDIDAATQIPDRHIISPTTLAEQLRGTPGITLERTFGELNLYAIDPALVREPLYAVAAADTRPGAQSNPSDALASAMRQSVLVSSGPPSCLTAQEGSAAPQIDVLSHDMNGYTVRVTAQAPSLLVLNQSYNQGWSARMVSPLAPNGVGCASGDLAHVVAAGFANGWWTPGPGTYLVRIAFRKQWLVDAAGAISLTAIVTAAGVIIGTISSLAWRWWQMKSRRRSRMSDATL